MVARSVRVDSVRMEDLPPLNPFEPIQQQQLPEAAHSSPHASAVSAAEESAVSKYQASKPLFEPFPRGSSTLLIAPSSSGKTYFLKLILENTHLYFRDPISRVVVVNGDSRITFYPLEKEGRVVPQVLQFTWDSFESWGWEDQLEASDVVILDDLSVFNGPARKLVTQLAHHLDLGHVFLVTHSLLQQRTYEILNFVHSALLFMQCSSVVRLCSYIVQTFYKDLELREFIKKIVAVCEREKTTLLLEINSLSVDRAPRHVAVSHLLSLITGSSPATAAASQKLSFAVVYPYPMERRFFASVEGGVASLSPLSNAETDLPPLANLVQGAFVILNMDSVAAFKSAAAEENSTTCVPQSEEVEWNKVTQAIELRIENYLPSVKWLPAKNLLREILSNPDICILRDQKNMTIYNNHKMRVSILDFILESTKKNFPLSKDKTKGAIRNLSSEHQLYRTYVKSLLSHSCPRMVFKNKLLLPHSF